jgi:pimeloyl-ACP methyl ester carboxylesterase
MADGDSQEPKLVLLPGMDGTGWLLENFAAALPTSMRPQIVRYPPTGCTSYAEVDAFLRSAGIDDEPFVLLAESYSSVAAIALAAATPTNLKGLVICVGFATPPVRKLLRPISSLLTHVLFALPRPTFVTKHWTAGHDAPKELLAKLKRIRTAIPADTFAARIRAVLTCDVRRELAQVRVPILFLHAKDDQLIDMACLEEMRAIQPQAEVEIFPGSHMLLERHPREAADRVARFVRERVEAH